VVAFPCPKSESNVNRRKIHYLHFHPVASNTDHLFCMHCHAYRALSIGRQRWLKAEYMVSYYHLATYKESTVVVAAVVVLSIIFLNPLSTFSPLGLNDSICDREW